MIIVFRFLRANQALLIIVCVCGVVRKLRHPAHVGVVVRRLRAADLLSAGPL